MTLKEAKALRDRIISEGPWATVPLGHGPDGYWAEIDCGAKTGRVKFFNPQGWEDYKVEQNTKRSAFLQSLSPRSAIEVLIDRACGLE